MSKAGYWTKGTGRGGEVEEFETFAAAKAYYHQKGRQQDSEDMDILLTDDDGNIIGAWEYEGRVWWNTDKYDNKNIDNI